MIYEPHIEMGSTTYISWCLITLGHHRSMKVASLASVNGTIVSLLMLINSYNNNVYLVHGHIMFVTLILGKHIVLKILHVYTAPPLWNDDDEDITMLTFNYFNQWLRQCFIFNILNTP